MNLEQIPPIVPNRFGFYETVVGRVFGPACPMAGSSGHAESHREGAAKSGAWGWVRLEQALHELGRLSETKLIVRRTTESHDPTRFGASWLPDYMASPVEGTSQQSPGDTSLSLQFRQAHRALEFR